MGRQAGSPGLCKGAVVATRWVPSWAITPALANKSNNGGCVILFRFPCRCVFSGQYPAWCKYRRVGIKRTRTLRCLRSKHCLASHGSSTTMDGTRNWLKTAQVLGQVPGSRRTDGQTGTGLDIAELQTAFQLSQVSSWTDSIAAADLFERCNGRLNVS